VRRRRNGRGRPVRSGIRIRGDPPPSLPRFLICRAIATWRRQRRRKTAFAAEEMRHQFAIESLEKPGALRPQPYLYTCVRCKWIFRINDSRGSIIALDGLGRHLPEPENAKRIVTFHRGPCPAFRVLEDFAPEIQRERRPHSYLPRLMDALRSLTKSSRRGHRRAEQTAAS
jgi:hypothetical protein